tara:strand:- start:23 stop:346 length:324 start_codon:yes stop_codon:yes gene_type:complete
MNKKALLGYFCLIYGSIILLLFIINHLLKLQIQDFTYIYGILLGFFGYTILNYKIPKFYIWFVSLASLYLIFVNGKFISGIIYIDLFIVVFTLIAFMWIKIKRKSSR